MKIAFVYDAVYPYTKGGVERRIHALSERLAAAHDVHIFGLQWWEGGRVRREGGITYHGVMPPHLAFRDGRRTLVGPLLFSLALLPPLFRERFDLLDCASIPYLPVIACRLASALVRVPLVVTWHEYWGRETWQRAFGVLGWVGVLVERLALRASPRIIAVSPFTARRIERNAHPIAVVGNGVDYDTIVRATRASHAYDVLFVGRFIPEKRIDLLLAALARIPAPHRPSCLLVGEGPERDRLCEETRALGLERSVTFRDFLSEREVYGFMKGAKVFVSPSEREGFGMAVLEAQACGTPTIVVTHPDNAAVDLVEDGVNGYRVPVDPTVLAARIEELLRNRPLHERMQREARNGARELDWGAISHKLEQLYNEIAGVA